MLASSPKHDGEWSFMWKHGTILIGQTRSEIASKAAALFVELWLRGVGAPFANKLMQGYVMYLERE